MRIHLTDASGPGKTYMVDRCAIEGLEPLWCLKVTNRGTYASVMPKGTTKEIEVVIEELDRNSSEEAGLWDAATLLTKVRWSRDEIIARLEDKHSWLNEQIDELKQAA